MISEHRHIVPAKFAKLRDAVEKIESRPGGNHILSVGDEAQSCSYFPASYRRKGNSYYLDHVGKTGLYRASSPDCYLYHWMDGTVFFVSNENCSAILVAHRRRGAQNHFRHLSLLCAL